MTAGTSPNAPLEALLQFLKRTRGLDFTGYKRASLERRFTRRMELVGCKSLGDYLDYLEVHPDEHVELLDSLLINVTEFFRDAPVWDHLRDEALPEMLAAKPADAPIRVWSAGCATGEEACTIAIVLCELLGDEDFRRRVKIYATDIDDDALASARAASYGARAIEKLAPGLRERYFTGADNRQAFRADLRRALIFGRNNLVADAPISRLDLLVCRNTLMYLTAETQAQILRHFHFALRDTGVLVLGKSETMIAHRELFAAVDLKYRIFRKLERIPSLQSRVTELVQGEQLEQRGGDEDRTLRDAAFEASQQPQLVVALSGTLTSANAAARSLFSIGGENLGQQLSELRVGREPADLGAAVSRALSERARVPLGTIEFQPDTGDERRLEVTVVPLTSPADAALGALVVFDDTTRFAELEQALETNRRELEAAYAELQSTIDELETTNEELQSANEELQTTNEELQSTNEELETMNEELQSTNEELETINDELRERTGELNRVNDFLEAILTSLGVAVAVLDRSQRVQIWNRRAEELWGLRSDEAAEQHFLALDIGLEPERLAPALRAVMSGNSERETASLDAVNRRGRAIVCDATVLPLVARGPEGTEIRGAIVLMEDQASRDGRA